MKLAIQFFIHRLLLLFICFVPATTISGQSNDFQHKKNSLLKVIASTEGEEKLKAYEILIISSQADQLSEEEVNLMLQYINDFLREARKQQNKKYEGIALSEEVYWLWKSLRLDEFEQKANEYLPILKKNGEIEPYYNVYGWLLMKDADKNYISKTMDVEQMLSEAKKDNCLYGIIKANLMMLYMYSIRHRFEDGEKIAFEMLNNALKLIKEKTNPPLSHYEVVSQAYNCLASTLYHQRKKKMIEFSSVLDDWKKYMTLFEKKTGMVCPHLPHYYLFKATVCLEKEKYDKAELYCDSMGNTDNSYIKIYIHEGRKEYNNAIDLLDKTIDFHARAEELGDVVHFQREKARILYKMGRTEEAYLLYKTASECRDSLYQVEGTTLLNEIRTQYEIDKYAAEKEHYRYYSLFAVGGCILLAISFLIWIYYSQKISRRNRTLAQQIKELNKQYEEQVNEMLAKTFFMTETENPEEINNGQYVDNRKEKLCFAVRNLLLKDKGYRDSSITQESVIKKLGTNRHIFTDAMESCIKMKFNDYLNLLRLKDAVQLLEQSNQSIEVISEIAGFGTVQNFRRQFNAKYNMTPKDYRNSIKSSK